MVFSLFYIFIPLMNGLCNFWAFYSFDDKGEWE